MLINFFPIVEENLLAQSVSLSTVIFDVVVQLVLFLSF
jgi:hypothetical protein